MVVGLKCPNRSPHVDGESGPGAMIPSRFDRLGLAVARRGRHGGMIVQRFVTDGRK